MENGLSPIGPFDLEVQFILSVGHIRPLDWGWMAAEPQPLRQRAFLYCFDVMATPAGWRLFPNNAMRTDRLNRFRHAAPAILPSLLQCDFGNLQSEVDRLQKAGCEVLHLDVMDGHFVPNLTYGMPIAAALRRHTDLLLDAHLMISDPAAYVDSFVEAGVDMITFHIEAVRDALPILKQIRSAGLLAGLALNPGTPLAMISDSLQLCDAVLVMSVDAGFGGQTFDPVALEKLQRLRQVAPDLLLEIDGGVNNETIGKCREAGADLFVVGSAIFKEQDYCEAISELTRSMQRDQHDV